MAVGVLFLYGAGRVFNAREAGGARGDCAAMFLCFDMSLPVDRSRKGSSVARLPIFGELFGALPTVDVAAWPADTRKGSAKRARCTALRELVQSMELPAAVAVGKEAAEGVLARRREARAIVEEVSSLEDAMQAGRDGFLYVYQEQTSKALVRACELGLPGVILSMPPGAGKTFTVLDAMLRLLQGGQRRVCVVVVPNILAAQWSESFATIRREHVVADVELTRVTSEMLARGADDVDFFPSALVRQLRESRRILLCEESLFMSQPKRGLAAWNVTTVRLAEALLRVEHEFGAGACPMVANDEGRMMSQGSAAGESIAWLAKALRSSTLVVVTATWNSQSNEQKISSTWISHVFTKEEGVILRTAVQQGHLKLTQEELVMQCALSMAYTQVSMMSCHGHGVKIWLSPPKERVSRRSLVWRQAVLEAKFPAVLQLVCGSVSMNGKPLVLCLNLMEVDAISRGLRVAFPGIRVEVLTGSVDHESVLGRVRAGEFDVLVGTIAAAGVGLDVRCLTDVVVVDGLRRFPALQQLKGRALRAPHVAGARTKHFVWLVTESDRLVEYGSKWDTFAVMYPEFRGAENPFAAAKQAEAMREGDLWKLALLMMWTGGVSEIAEDRQLALSAIGTVVPRGQEYEGEDAFFGRCRRVALCGADALSVEDEAKLEAVRAWMNSGQKARDEATAAVREWRARVEACAACDACDASDEDEDDPVDEVEMQ